METPADVSELSKVCHTLTLVCEDGQLPASADVLRMCSPVELNTAIELAQQTTLTKQEGSTPELKVDGSLERWKAILSFLYPVFPRPDFTFQTVADILPIVHKYNIVSLLGGMQQWLQQQLPAELNSTPDSVGYVFNWLRTSEQLQLDCVKQTCLKAIPRLHADLKSGLCSGKLDSELMQLSQGLMLEVVKAICAGPATCPHCMRQFTPGTNRCGWCGWCN